MEVFRYIPTLPHSHTRENRLKTKVQNYTNEYKTSNNKVLIISQIYYKNDTQVQNDKGQKSLYRDTSL